MKCFTVWALIIVLGGCTTLRPIGAESPDFARRIASGELLKVGDHVAFEKAVGTVKTSTCN